MENTEFNVELNINNIRSGIAPLYCRYPGQCNPQPAYVQMTQHGVIKAGYSLEVGTASPADIWHGRTCEWNVPAEVKGAALVALLEKESTLSLFERVYQGHAVVWNGHNHVGRLDADATKASEELQALFDGLTDEVLGLVFLLDWFGGNQFSDVWPSDKTLEVAVKDAHAEMAEQGVFTDEDLRAHFLKWLQLEYESERRQGLGQPHYQALVAELPGTLDWWVEDVERTHHMVVDGTSYYASAPGVSDLKALATDLMNGFSDGDSEWYFCAVDGEGQEISYFKCRSGKAANEIAREEYLAHGVAA